MADRLRTAALVHEVLLDRWPGRFGAAAPDDATSLGETGLGLDSIDVVEYLLACEERFAGPTTDALLAAGPISFGHLVDHFCAA
ncbi:MAG TPA: hypothetical protein VGM33_24620 [Baekduia sp.]